LLNERSPSVFVYRILGIHSKIDGHELGKEKKSICKCASYLLWLGNEVMFYCVSNPCDSREEFDIDFNLA